MKARSAARESAHGETPQERAPARHLVGGRYRAINGHCIYCSAFSCGRVCRAHTDLPPLDPVFAPTIIALLR